MWRNLLTRFGVDLGRRDRVRDARKAAADAFLTARRRGDTRAQHDALERLQRATAECLRVGV